LKIGGSDDIIRSLGILIPMFIKKTHT
jgi:hypothetical protein